MGHGTKCGRQSWRGKFKAGKKVEGASQVVLVGNTGDVRDTGSIPANTGDVRDTGSIPELGRSPGGGHSNPLQYSCLESPTDTGAWWATVQWFTQSWT